MPSRGVRGRSHSPDWKAEHAVCPHTRPVIRCAERCARDPSLNRPMASCSCGGCSYADCCRAGWAGRSRVRGTEGFTGCLRRAAAHRGSRRLAALRLRGTRDRVPGGARDDRDEPVRRPGPWYRGARANAGTRPAARVVSGVQRGPCRRRGGPGHRVVQTVRPGNRRNPGRRPVAETARSLDDRTRPDTDRPAQPDPDAWSEAQDPAHRDLAAHGARGGDDRRAQLRAAKPRTGAAPGARAAPPTRAGASRSPGAMALHRNRDRLAAASPFRAWMPRSCRSPNAVPLRFTLIVGGRRMPEPGHVMLPRSWHTAVTRDPWPPTGPAPLIRQGGCRVHAVPAA
jgi:hypothetical protein